MANWLDLTKIIPGLEKGQWLNVVNTPLNPLVDSLSENGFSVIVIEGSEVVDSSSFFRQAKKVFGFPDYFGQNWAAWNDCLGDFELSIAQRTAIVWNDADKTFMADAKTFILAAFDLYNMALSAGSIKASSNNAETHQVEFLLVGNIEGFKNTLDFEK